MKATFLGHGLDIGDQPNVGKQLVKSFQSPKYKRFDGLVAFASISGVNMLKGYVNEAKNRYDQLRFFIGVDNRGTSKEALEVLIQQNIETYIYHDRRNLVTYHPKLFIFEGDVYTRVIIGSSNLTSSGLKMNLEASVQIDFRTKTDKQGQNFLRNLKEYYFDILNLKTDCLKPLTKDYLKELISKNLLFNQFEHSNKPKEPVTTDGENPESQDEFNVTNYDIESGEEQIHTNPRSYKHTFTTGDYERFDTLLKRYIEYKEKKRPSGIVSKHTKDRELFRWYQKMHALYGYNDNSLPTEILSQLLDVEFPFDGVGKERKRLIKWNKDFQKVVDYKRKVEPKSEYTYVPQFKDTSNKYYEVGRWCAWQKQRRKGNKNYGAEWTQYEEDKMNSINFIWDASSLGSRPKDDKWSDSLVELENYYNKKKNRKTVPSQTTYIGHWLSDQMSLKTKQDREGTTNLISPIRVELLGELLAKNGVEWEWRKQKEREGIESKIESWKIVEKLENEGKIKEFREKNPKLLKKYRGDVAQLRSHTKRWNNEKNKWKFELVGKVGFPYEKE
ncbi:phospholipase D-like domain-containing protein [Flavobacteriaceae bacterium LMO-SS05]